MPGPRRPVTGPVRAGRRWSLRARLIALILAITAASLVGVDVVLTVTVRSQLVGDRDAALTSVVRSLPRQGALDADRLRQISNANPLRGGDIGWTLVRQGGMATVVLASPRAPGDNPAVGATPATAGPATVGDAGTSPDRYRILAVPVEYPDGTPGFLVAWVSLAEVSATLNRLILLETLITLGLLVLVGVVASVTIRRELRPLQAVAQAADQIAAGDLSLRVRVDDAGTEVGRLGRAFNGMLDGVGSLLDERIRGEERLRQFVADASHELRTPVAAVRGYAELYAAGALPDRTAVDRAMVRVGFESRRMGELVEDLLTLIRADAAAEIRRDPVAMVELLTGVIDDAAVIDRSRTWRLAGAAAAGGAAAGPGCTAAGGGGAAPVPAGPVTVLGDRLRLHQLFANLLANVRTHTPPGTTATVSILPGPHQVAVRVADDGPGVAEEDLPKLFDRFFRAEKSRSRESGGSGLGLTIVAAIAAAHGGEVIASRGAEGGLSMTVVLPRAVGTGAVSGPAPADAVPASGTAGAQPGPTGG